LIYFYFILSLAFIWLDAYLAAKKNLKDSFLLGVICVGFGAIGLFFPHHSWSWLLSCLITYVLTWNGFFHFTKYKMMGLSFFFAKRHERKISPIDVRIVFIALTIAWILYFHKFLL